MASHDDLEWATGYAFGTPVRFGTPAAQLKQFIDTTGGMWQAGVFVDKAVPPGYTDPVISEAGGNRYGASHATGPTNAPPDAVSLAAAHHQGRRLARVADLIQPA